jgi:hypothetical protein
LRNLLERLRAGRRPPTGPLTTTEQTAADHLREQTPVKDRQRSERDQGDRSRRSDREA